MKALGFDQHVEDVENGICPFCKKVIKIEEFDDELFLKEYKISGLCPTCQNEIFNSKKKETNNKNSL